MGHTFDSARDASLALGYHPNYVPAELAKNKKGVGIFANSGITLAYTDSDYAKEQIGPGLENEEWWKVRRAMAERGGTQ